MPPRAAPLDIGIYVPFNLSISRGILEGVNRFRAEHPSLRAQIDDGAEPGPHSPRACAVIVFNAGDVSAKLRPGTRVVVNLSNRLGAGPNHSVLNDDVAVGRMAADHLIDRGFPRFGFVGFQNVHLSHLRYLGFRDRIRERLGSAAPEVPERDMADRSAVLRDLHLPCGVFTVNDQAAARVVDAALDLGLRIPEDLAVLGVDDDPLRCAMSRVELSSVRPDSLRQGYEAMALAHRLLADRRKPPEPILRLIAPLGVTTRRSTDTFAHPDPQVVSALRIVRDRIRELRGVDDLARACGLGVRTLERLFHETLQTTPREALNRARFDFARALLIQTRLSVSEIAHRSGYADVRTFIWQCKLRTGQTPATLRRDLVPH